MALLPQLGAAAHCFSLIQQAAASTGGDADGSVANILGMLASCEMPILTEFIARSRSAVNENTIHLLISSAVDAFHNNDGGIARLYLRAAMFFECYLLDPANFLSNIRSEIPEELRCPAFKSFVSFLIETASRIGMLDFLQSRIAAYCTCLNA